MVAEVSSNEFVLTERGGQAVQPDMCRGRVWCKINGHSRGTRGLTWTSSPMKRITAADIEQMRANGYDRSTIAEAESRLNECRRADELIDLVRRAFAGVELDDGIGLRESDGIDDYAGLEELARLRTTDEKHDWQKIPADELNYCNAAPSFLDAKGMRFHTPAFLVAELRGEFDQDFIGRLIDGSYSATDFPRLLTNDQCAAIIECIRFYGSIMNHRYESDRIDAAVKSFRRA